MQARGMFLETPLGASKRNVSNNLITPLAWCNAASAVVCCKHRSVASNKTELDFFPSARDFLGQFTSRITNIHIADCLEMRLHSDLTVLRQRFTTFAGSKTLNQSRANVVNR